MATTLLSILSSAPLVVTADNSNSKSGNESLLGKQPFRELMAQADARQAVDNKNTSEQQVVGQLIDRVPPAFLVIEDATTETALSADIAANLIDVSEQAAQMDVTSNEAELVGVVTHPAAGEILAGTVAQPKGSAKMMLSAMDVEPVAWAQEYWLERSLSGAAQPTADVQVVPATDMELDVVITVLPLADDMALDVNPSAADGFVSAEDESNDEALLLAADVAVQIDQSVVVSVTPVALPVVAVNDVPSVDLSDLPEQTAEILTSVSRAAVPVTSGVDKDGVQWGSAPAIPMAARPADQALAHASEMAQLDDRAVLDDVDMDAEVEAVIQRAIHNSNQQAAKNAAINVTPMAAPAPNEQALAAAPHVFNSLLAETPAEAVDVDVQASTTSSGGVVVGHTSDGTSERFASMTVLKVPPSPNGQHVPVADQVHVTVKQAIKQGSDHIMIQLDPADLGRIEVRMDIHHDGRAHLMMIADNRDTLDMLQRDVRMLERMLQEAGLDTSSQDMQFELAQDQQGQRSGDEEDNKGYGKPAQSTETEETISAPVASQYMVQVNQGLDIKV